MGANVLGNSQNRQQIGTILQSMGFETDDIAKAFTIFEKSYGDQQHGVSVLTEIVFEVQQQNEQNENKMDDQTKMQSHSAPNSPKNQKLQQPNASNHTQPILHHNKFQPLNTNKATQKIATNNKNDTEMLSIFNSLKISNKNKKYHNLCVLHLTILIFLPTNSK